MTANQSSTVCHHGAPSTSADDAVLCVDLDGTLLKSDSLVESLAVLLQKYGIWYVLKFPIWLSKGRAYFKRQVAKAVDLDASTLPYNSEVLSFLRDRKASGTRLILATAANEKIAQTVAGHLQLFDEVLASDDTVNLKGLRKLEAIKKRSLASGFDYIGDSKADLPIWAAARNSYVAGSNRSIRALKGCGISFHSEFQVNSVFNVASRAIRVVQWSKNLLLFVPLILAHQLFNASALINVMIGFFAFSFCASSVYLLNDVVDIQSDRAHPTKRNRPVAAGDISLQCAIGIAVALILLSATLAISVSLPFAVLLATYWIATLLYTIELKKWMVVDVIILSTFYTVRLVGGAILADVELSPWLISFSTFFFLSLALCKRHVELIRTDKPNDRRGYQRSDTTIISQLGVASGLIAVLIFALYIHESEASVALYPHSAYLWFLCPILLYWIMRVWLLVQRGDMHDDPIVFALKDRASYLCAVLTVILTVVAST